MMRVQFYLRLLIICAIFSHGIAVFLNENFEGFSDLLIRQKRVVDLTRNGGLPQQLSRAPYLVNVLEDNISKCAASIVSDIFLITVRQCVYPLPEERYSILSGSAMRDNGTHHNIVRRSLYLPNVKIVLVQIFPPIDLRNSPNRIISLFAGVVPHPAYGTFTGWGCTMPGYFHEPRFPEQLMQTRLPIIPTIVCRQLYARRARITNDEICTHDVTKRRGTCIGDLGGPLVYSDRLLGIMSALRGVPIGQGPDVFVNLNHPEIHEWVTNTINNPFHH